MSITYRTTGAWGPGKGANLTPAEVDGNFHDLATRITAVEENPAEPVQISAITSSGSALTITMDNGDVYGPLALPVASFVYRGAWVPATDYKKNDVVTWGSQVYDVAADHTSDATFNPARTISGVNVYQLMVDAYPAALEAAGWALTSGTQSGIAFTINADSSIDAAVDFTQGVEAYQDAIGSLINTGSQSGIAITYDDVNNRIDFAVTLTQYTDALAQDAFAAALAAGTHTGIAFSYNDAANSLSAAVSQIAFTALSDVPLSYAGQGGKLVTVKADGTGLEFVSPNALVPVAAVPRFMGALVNMAASTAAQNYAAGIAIPFGAEQYDTDAFHDTVTNNTRLTIPAGLGIKKVKVSATVRVSSIAAGSDNFLAIRKNSLETYLGSPALHHENSAATATTIAISSGPIPVVAGDYFDCWFSTSDTSTGLEADRTSFSIEVVEVEGGINIANVQGDATTARTLALADINAHLLFSSASVVTVTAPANASVAFPIGSSLTLEQGGAGQVAVSGASGVTIRKPSGKSGVTAGLYSVLSLRKVASDSWTLYGDMA